MARLDRWLRRAASTVGDETLLATLSGEARVGERTRACVLVATSGHVVRYVPRLRRAEVTTVAAADLLDVSTSDDGRSLTIVRTDGEPVVVERIEDAVALEAFVGVLDRLGRRHQPDHPSHRRPGHGHVRAVRPTSA